MISKELLGKVLNHSDNIKIELIMDNPLSNKELIISYVIDNVLGVKSITIKKCELIELFAEFIYKNDFVFNLDQHGVYGIDVPAYDLGLWCTKERHKFRQDPRNACKVFENDSSIYEAFKRTCEWILENRSE